MSEDQIPVVGRNGVVVLKPINRPKDQQPGYRTYEVHQRERVGESTEKIKPVQLISEKFRREPYPLLATLRDNYPLYRDWLTNCYWLTPYNDVTSVFVDDANFESRSKTWYYNLENFGRNLGDELDVLTVEATLMDESIDSICEELLGALQSNNRGDLARDFAALLPLHLLATSLDLPQQDREHFYAMYWRAQRGVGWLPKLQIDGRRALDELVQYFTPLVQARRLAPGPDMLSVMAQLELQDGPTTAQDVVVTLLERDHETLHGSLANLWFLLLTHPLELEKVGADARLMKLAYLETLRHSAPVISARRFARHEVERFGKLLPAGALIVCSAGAANRDPNVFSTPDQFIVDRPDLCQREPRGQYRADGLATGIAFGLGKPSIHPAVPENRPRSRYAINRDLVTIASMRVVQMLDDLHLPRNAQPYLTALTVGEMHTCWQLPVSFKARKV